MSEIYGNTTGLPPSAIKTLEHIYRRKIPLERVATPELLRSLAEASKQTGRQVGALVHRSGKVDYVVVGDASKLVLPDIGRLRAKEGRFRGLRLIHTHPNGEPLTRDNVRSIRPGHGLAPKFLPMVLGRRACRDINRGTPLSWSLFG